MNPAQLSNSPWFHGAFKEDYLDVYLHRDSAEAKTAASFLADVLELNPGLHHLLDLCCGGGRHLLPLSAHVRSIIGLDLSEELLQYAGGNKTIPSPGHRSLGTKPGLVRGNMLNLPFANDSFDRLVNLFTSFGYFHGEAANQATLAEMARVLRPDGRLVLDHINLEIMLHSLQDNSERELPDGRRILETRCWDTRTRRINKRIELSGKNIATRSWTESVRVYSIEEIEDMINKVSMQAIEYYGDYDGSAWNQNSSRMILIAVKRI